MMKNWLTISEFGERTGLSIKALRIYEERGILNPHTRSESRYRVYTAEQVLVAERVVHYKHLGFSLEQIKALLRETNGQSLQELLEARLCESRKSVSLMQQQIKSLESILTSLKQDKELSETERSQVMENIIEISENNLKRKGIMDERAFLQVREEIALYSSEKKQVIAGIREIIDYAKKENILLGPGRGNSAGSLVLFGEGYSKRNPMDYGLLPELFSASKFIWLDVEYSRHQEIGRMCDELSQKTGVEVIAFRSPLLDIFKSLEQKIGKVEFNSFSDFDPMILHAPQNGTRGLFWLDWSPDFHAHQNATQEWKEKSRWKNDELEAFFKANVFNGPMDYMVQDCLMSLGMREEFFAYPRRTISDCPESLPELKDTKGLLIFREDWLKILARTTGISILEANKIQRAVAQDANAAEVSVLEKVTDTDIRERLRSSCRSVYSKAHSVNGWLQYKQTAILKGLWPKEYLAAIDEWEQKHGLVWFEFGYKPGPNEFYLKANS
ncbi:MerR family transcriptional regulator [Bdellovibrio bacteriovorus]|uniref:MerR family transcriptional regulator n=1 Tax=Bdellovibrio bacteriovorus TaxID=959 RepID=UPI003AA9B4FD